MITVEDMNEALAWWVEPASVPFEEMLREIGIESAAVDLFRLDVREMEDPDAGEIAEFEEVAEGTGLEGQGIEVAETIVDTAAQNYFGGLVVALKAAAIAAEREQG